MEYREIKTLKKQVEHCLRQYPLTRNSDITLTIQLWRVFYPHKIKMSMSRGEAVALSDLYHLPRESNVKRARAYIQNERKMYLPTELKVALKRGILEDEWRVATGYPTKETAGTEKPSWTPPSLTPKLL